MRSLRTKLVMIMVILILALMCVIGAFLINGVGNFYISQFYEQMEKTFSPEFIGQLQEIPAQEQNAPERMKELLMAQAGLGIDIATRNVYILDETGNVLASSNQQTSVSMTANLLTAMNGEVGQESSITSSFMDLAVPIASADSTYIVYILDSRATVDALTGELFSIILSALGLGLVICVVLSFLLAQILITPIRALTLGTRQVAAGDFSQRIEVEGQDEIGVLTRNFNHMAKVLQDTISEAENERNKLSTLFLHMTDGVVACVEALVFQRLLNEFRLAGLQKAREDVHRNVARHSSSLSSEERSDGAFVQLRADYAHTARDHGAALADIALAGHVVEVNPAVRIVGCNVALGTQNHAVLRGVFQLLQDALDLLGCELLVRLHAPADEDLVGVVPVVMVMVVMLVLVVLVVMMVMAGAVRIVAFVVVIMVVMVVMMLVLLVFVIIVMVVMVMMLMLAVFVVVMVVAGAVRIVARIVLVVVMMVMLVRFFFQLLQLHRDGGFLLHRLHQLLTGQLIPRGGDKHGVGVVVAEELDALVELLFIYILRARENDGVGGFNLVVVTRRSSSYTSCTSWRRQR